MKKKPTKPGAKFMVMRGIENKEGQRIEPGQYVTMAELLQLFGPDIVDHWQKSRVLQEVTNE